MRSGFFQNGLKRGQQDLSCQRCIIAIEGSFPL